MKWSYVLVLGFAILAACQTKPTKIDTALVGAVHGFLPPPLWNESMQNLKQKLVVLQPNICDEKKSTSPIVKHSWQSKSTV